MTVTLHNVLSLIVYPYYREIHLLVEGIPCRFKSYVIVNELVVKSIVNVSPEANVKSDPKS